jgi:hypothetical protein
VKRRAALLKCWQSARIIRTLDNNSIAPHRNGKTNNCKRFCNSTSPNDAAGYKKIIENLNHSASLFWPGDEFDLQAMGKTTGRQSELEIEIPLDYSP